MATVKLHMKKLHGPRHSCSFTALDKEMGQTRLHSIFILIIVLIQKNLEEHAGKIFCMAILIRQETAEFFTYVSFGEPHGSD